jgi:chemotaxis regulatin CheY-phosphate phosphatase CheZ
MKDMDIKGLIKKAEELRALFILGQRVVPFLEELFAFVGEIQPLLEEINTSIQENLSKMPNLSKQLSKVTEATELATNEILDIVDGVFYKLDILSSTLKEFESSQLGLKDFFEDFNKLVGKFNNGSFSIDDLKLNLSSLQAKSKDILSVETKINSMKEMIDNIRNDSSSIMLALQVQDITSQQIAAVNHLLNTVQTRLNSLISKFQSGEITKVATVQEQTTNVTELHRVIAFDPDAVESLIDNAARQDEIDKLFEQQTIEDTSSSKEPDNKTAQSTETLDSEEKISQDDIDKLFNQNS